MKLKTIIEAETMEVHDTGLLGIHTINKKGSTRVVLSYLVFPHTLEGEKRRGFQFLEQEADVEHLSSVDGGVTYNSWKNKKA